MKAGNFVGYILAAFITGTILLIYIQYNSAKNINSLISNNEKYADEYTINTELKGLEKDLVLIDKNIRTVINSNDRQYISGLDLTIANIQQVLNQLQQVSDNAVTAKEIDRLDALVKIKINNSRALLDTFYTSGKLPAVQHASRLEGRLLMDSINLSVQKIENSRHNIITRLTIENDKNGDNALRFNNILIALILICGAALFWFIINAIRKRESLIQQLHESEQMIKESAKIKEQFMANMSHEIRTPMNAILGFSNLLQQKELDPESKEFVGTIQRSAQNLLTIIDDVLDLSKIEAGMMRIESAPFSIRSLLHSIEAMFRSKAEEKGLAIHVDVDATIPDILEGDATRLTQVLINLVGNALKFTKQGSVSISITNEGATATGIKTGIRITDTGIGIEPEKQADIFNRFQQADSSITRGYGGTGLGLSIVKDLVQLQNGTIALNSEPGKGTSFFVIIPYNFSTEVAPVRYSEEEPALPGHDFSNIRILVVEDNEINQDLIRQLFKRWGLAYTMARNGREALEKLKAENYSLILMDIQMPEMDGYTTTKEIRNSLQSSVPIIAMTAHALAGEKEKCLSYGMNGYISKPIREGQLFNIIRENTRQYQYIDLQYLKEICAGNIASEQALAGQFIEVIPEDLVALEKAWLDKQIVELRQLAHNMKTTISVMGLNQLLQPLLDSLEYEELTEAGFRNAFQAIQTVCEGALQEARHFYDNLAAQR